MINVCKEILKIFKRDKLYKNFIKSNILIFVFIILLSSFNIYFNYKIEHFINEETKKQIYIYDLENKDILNDFKKEYSKYIDRIFYIIETFETIDNKEYNLSTDLLDFNTNKASIRINSKNDIKKIQNVMVEEVIIDDYLPENLIYLNQNLIEQLVQNNYKTNSIVIDINDYYKIDALEENLISKGANANKSIENDSDINTYFDVQHSLTLFTYMFSILSLILIIYLSISFISSQERDIMIMNVLGYSDRLIKMLYILSTMYLIIPLYIIIAIIFIGLSLLIKKVLALYLLKSLYIPLIIIIIFYIIAIIIGITIMKKRSLKYEKM